MWYTTQQHFDCTIYSYCQYGDNKSVIARYSHKGSTLAIYINFLSSCPTSYVMQLLSLPSATLHNKVDGS